MFDCSLPASKSLLPDFVENEHFYERLERSNFFVPKDMEMLDDSSTCEFKMLALDTHGDNLDELFTDLFSGSISN